MLSREEQQVLEDQKLSCQGAIKVLTKARDCQFASDVDESYASWVESHNELIKHQEALLGAIDSALQSLDAKDAEIAHLYSAVALGDKFLARKDAEITQLEARVQSLFASADEMTRIIVEEREASAERISALEKELADATARNSEQEVAMVCLTVLAVGCKEHPSYRAKKPVGTTCEACNRMQEARKALKEVAKDG